MKRIIAYPIFTVSIFRMGLPFLIVHVFGIKFSGDPRVAILRNKLRDLGSSDQPQIMFGGAGRGSRIRTCGLKYPKLPRYRAAPYPDGRGVANMTDLGEQGRAL
jgi:hypothetical protein